MAWPSTLVGALVLAMAGACGDDPISVRNSPDDGADYNRGELMTAVGGFVAAGRTPQAYQVFAEEVARLRPGMDETVADLAELELVMLALVPIETLRNRPGEEQTAQLALTVWPVALSPPLDALPPDGWRDRREALVAPHAGELAGAYVLRLCEGPYAVECKHVVPEWQGPVLGAEAIARLTARTRAAVANCRECTAPSWAEAVSRWETLDRAAVRQRQSFEDLGAATRWPIAGPAAAAWPAAVAAVVVIEDDGDWVIDELVIPPNRRDGAFDRIRGRGPTLGVHVTPTADTETIRALIKAASAEQFTELAVQARAPYYPWELRAYRMPIGASKKPGKVKPSSVRAETVQVHLRRLDAKNGQKKVESQPQVPTRARLQ